MGYIPTYITRKLMYDTDAGYGLTLPADVTAGIEDFLHDIPKPLKRSAARKLYGEAYAKERFKSTHKKAYGEAVRSRHPRPEVFAKNAALKEAIERRDKNRTEARERREELRQQKRLNKHCLKREIAAVACSRRKKLVGGVSKLAPQPVRRVPQKDKVFLDIIGKCERGGQLGRAPLVLSFLTDKPLLRDYTLPCWDKTSSTLKIMAMSHQSHISGGITINLHLSPNVHQQAMTSSKGPAPYMQDRIRKAFMDALDTVLPFWFILEYSRKTKTYHLHGAVVLPSVPDAQIHVDQALRIAGGKWDHDKAQYHQQKSKPLNDPFVWASYAVKAMNITRHKLFPDQSDDNKKIFAASNEMRRLAKDGWDKLRGGLPQPGKR
ncbi:hypothetical protein [Asticcacaulis endophyticus]|uniref:Uncharacterized protein n=1 Tax=Asticcacaulis endophyticus TaxID=1395890 RepID=A0A918US70_9CAUL|nr:hypothetical protein [Asticcacaulis endophyticus]GGZ30631.1 hypothetical protein GCM10011273_16300 [Asticcacaulis endophyticus]